MRRAPLRLLVLLALAACTPDTSEQLKGALEDSLREKLEARARPPAPVTAPAPGESTRPQLLANKLGLYVACISASRARAGAALDAAAALFDDKGRLRAGARLPPDLLPPEALDRCRKAHKEGPHLQPAQPDLEAALAAYAEALDRAYSDVGDLAALLARDLPRKERDAAAAPLRGRLVDAQAAWHTAAPALTQAIDAAQDEIDAATLANVEERAGKGLEYACRAFVIRARPLARCLGEHADAAACEGAFFEVEQAHGDLHAQLAAARAAGATSFFWLDRFITSADELYSAARDLMKQARSGDARAGRTRVVEEFADLQSDARKLNFELPAAPADEPAP